MKRGLFLFIGLIFVASLYGYYGRFSDARAWQQSGRHNYELKKQFHAMGSTSKIIAKLQQKVADQPNDPNGWYLLGKLYLSQQATSQAANMFEKAYQLNSNDRRIVYHYAKCLYLTKQSKQAREIVAANLAHHPDKDDYYLAGLIAYSQTDYVTTIQAWESALKFEAPDSDTAVALSNAINEVRLKTAQ